MGIDSSGFSKLSTDHPFRRHSENLQALIKGLRQAERVHKEAIRQGDVETISFASRMHALMVGMIAESRLRKIAADPTGFNDRERQLIGRENAQIEKWKAAVDLAFRRQYSVPIHLEIDATTVDLAIISRRRVIIDLLENELRPIIEDRNKTAHGQWIWHLNNKETSFVKLANPPLNYLEIHRRGELIASLASIVHTLAVSEPTFQRDFDRLYGEVRGMKKIIDGLDYPQFEAQLRAQIRRRIESIRHQGAV